MIGVLRASVVGLALALALTGCASGTRLVLGDGGRVLVEGTNRDSPLYRAMLDVYQACGGVSGEKMTYVNWRADPVLPVWTEERGWHFKDVECISPEESDTLEFHP